MTEPTDLPAEALERAAEIAAARFGPNVTDEQLQAVLDEVAMELVKQYFANIAKHGKAVTDEEKRALTVLFEQRAADLASTEAARNAGLSEADLMAGCRAAWDAGLLRVETVRCGHGVKLVPVTSPVGMAH